MKISEINEEYLLEYLRIEKDDLDEIVLSLCRESARQYIISYTGLSEEEIDNYPDLTVAYMVLVQDQYDNRTMAPDAKYANSANRVVDNILSMHVRNFI